MDRGGPDGQNGLFRITASMWSMWSIENSFFAHLTTEEIPVFFNPVFQFFPFFCLFLSQTVDEPIFLLSIRVWNIHYSIFSGSGIPAALRYALGEQ